MTFTAFILVLASVLLHAGWHFIAKSKNKNSGLAFFLTISAGSIFLTMPVTIFFSGVDFSALPPMFWVFAMLGGACGVLCNGGLCAAYRLSDISLAYPLARALPVLLTAAVTEIAYFGFGYGKPLGFCGIIGMFIIFAGSIMMPLNDFASFRLSRYTRNRALGWIFVAALGTTGYTVFDKAGFDLLMKYGSPANMVAGSCAYSSVREISLFCILFSAVLLIPQERKNYSPEVFKRWSGYFAGVAAAAAYLLVLIAMHGVSNVSYIQALRQMSLPVGVFLGIFFLKEKAAAPKLTGLVLIVAGLILASFK